MQTESQRRWRRAYYRKHRRKIIDSVTKWRREHPDCIQRQLARQRVLRRTNPAYREECNRRCREDYRKHIARYALRNAQQAKTYKQRARMHLQYLIKIRKVIRPSQCDSCKQPCQPHGHHYRGYSKPERVIWLCSLCHGEVHLSHARPTPKSEVSRS